MKFEYPLIIDGGISNELELQGCDLHHDLWTARLIDSDEESVKKVHLAYMEAGAQFVTSVGYQASIKGLVENGNSHKEAVRILQKSILLLEEARDAYYAQTPNCQQVHLVASIGPYGAYKADGSEYKGNYGLSYEELKSFHEERLLILDQSNADIIAFETIPDQLEAQVIADITKTIQTPCWISFSCKDDEHISDGTALAKMAEVFKDHPSIFAIGANCIPPDFVPGIISALKKGETDKRIIVYPNSGGYYDSKGKKWYANNEKFKLTLHVDDWLALGADIIGGCCKIGAEEIKELSNHMKRL